MPAHRLRTLGVLAVVGILAAATASCSGQSESKSSTAAVAAPALRDAAKPSSAAGGAVAHPGVDLAVAKRPAGDRQVISTAQLDVEARNIDQTVQRATAIVVAAQGYVFSESASLTTGQHAHVVFKVAPESFSDVIARIGRLGTLVTRRISTQDVTGQVVDIGARLEAAQTSAERLRQLLANSGGVADLLNVEQQLTAREGQVDSLSGELGALRAQVDLATITLDVSPRATHKQAQAKPKPGFSRGLHAGSGAFANTARVISVMVGFLLPFSPLLLFALVGWWLVRRRGAAAAPTA